jgi:hypothetical protein
MADKLDWLNKHLILLRHISVEDAVQKENYTIPPDLEDEFRGVDSAETMVFKLAGEEKYNNACNLMAFIAHRRAAVWWAYRCVLSVYEETDAKPPFFETGEAPKPPFPLPKLPDYPPPKPDPALLAALKAKMADMDAKIAALSAKVNPGMLKYVEDGVQRAWQQFEKDNGVNPLVMLDKLGNRMKQDPYRIDPNSPIFKAMEAQEAALQAQKADIIGKIQGAFPKPAPAHDKKLRTDALAAAYAWIVAPDYENSQKCLAAGNACSGTPAGLLALSAFWAYGNMAPPNLDQVIPTPAGLAANGVDKTLLLCALAQGGTREMKERWELYFNIGVDVLTGKDNWGESLVDKEEPHEKPAEEAVRPVAARPAPVYRRWKPE